MGNCGCPQRPRLLRLGSSCRHAGRNTVDPATPSQSRGCGRPGQNGDVPNASRTLQPVGTSHPTETGTLAATRVIWTDRKAPCKGTDSSDNRFPDTPIRKWFQNHARWQRKPVGKNVLLSGKHLSLFRDTILNVPPRRRESHGQASNPFDGVAIELRA